MKRFLLAILCVLWAGGMPACVQAQFSGPATTTDLSASATPTPERRLLYPAVPEVALTPGDEISVHLFGITDYAFTGRISMDGTVLLPLIGVTTLGGSTVTQAEKLIAQQLVAAGEYRDPQVVLTRAESPSSIISFVGEMHGVVPVLGSRSLYAAIAVAGGLPPTASRTLTVLRPGAKTPLSVDLGNDPMHSEQANIPLFAGDTVVVSRIGVVYVSGEFHKLETVPLTNYGPLTLSQVSSIAGGPLADAKYNNLHIIRTVGDRRTVTTVNIKDVLYGKVPDPIMQPNDIVFLPASAVKSSITNGSLGSVLGVVSLAIASISTIK